jgi:hypothetical protein
MFFFIDQNHKVYQRLIKHLRKYSTRKGMTDAQVVQEWELYATGEDEDHESECICGKKELR